MTTENYLLITDSMEKAFKLFTMRAALGERVVIDINKCHSPNALLEINNFNLIDVDIDKSNFDSIQSTLIDIDIRDISIEYNRVSCYMNPLVLFFRKQPNCNVEWYTIINFGG